LHSKRVITASGAMWLEDFIVKKLRAWRTPDSRGSLEASSPAGQLRAGMSMGSRIHIPRASLAP
jgi:hypothetical protein